MQYCTSKSNPEPYIVPIVSYHVLIANRAILPGSFLLCNIVLGQKIIPNI